MKYYIEAPGQSTEDADYIKKKTVETVFCLHHQRYSFLYIPRSFATKMQWPSTDASEELNPVI